MVARDDKFIGDGTIAILMTVVLFMVPSGRAGRKPLLDWKTASRIPWGLLLLFGGGLAIAEGFKVTELSQWVGERLGFLEGVHPILMIASICLMITLLTEVTSNTAITAVMMPILASLALEIDVNPMLLMIGSSF